MLRHLLSAQNEGGDQAYKPSHESTTIWKQQEENPAHVQNKLAHDLKHSKEHFENKNLESKQEEKHNHQSHEQDYDHTKYYVTGVAERLELQERIGEAPGGAILSLTLGTVLICCNLFSHKIQKRYNKM